MLGATDGPTVPDYTGNERGFRFSIGRMTLALFAGRKLSQTLPGLENFYMVGQWAGIQASLSSLRWAAMSCGRCANAIANVSQRIGSPAPEEFGI